MLDYLDKNKYFLIIIVWLNFKKICWLVLGVEEFEFYSVKVFILLLKDVDLCIGYYIWFFF